MAVPELMLVDRIASVASSAVALVTGTESAVGSILEW